MSETIEKIKGLIKPPVSFPEFMDLTDSLRFEVIEKWCLCRYCMLHDPTNEKFNEWLTKLNEAMQELRDLRIKGNKPDKKEILTKIFVREFEEDKNAVILGIMMGEFNILGVEDEIRMEIAVDFNNSVYDIVDAVCDKEIDIKDYNNKTFNQKEKCEKEEKLASSKTGRPRTAKTTRNSSKKKKE